ncbi:MAG: amidase family protein, partial [Candidatus Bathyarchaeia archaeon]
TRNRGFGAEVRRRIILGTYALSAGYFDKFFLKAAKIANLVKREFRRALEQFDLIAGPTMPFPAFKLGEKINDPLSLYRSDVDTVPINLAGLPAISLTCSVQNGLPIGMQLIASPFQEDLLLRTAFALEKKFDITQRPQL